jgi:hypothetical protein
VYVVEKDPVKLERCNVRPAAGANHEWVCNDCNGTFSSEKTAKAHWRKKRCAQRRVHDDYALGHVYHGGDRREWSTEQVFKAIRRELDEQQLRAKGLFPPDNDATVVRASDDEALEAVNSFTYLGRVLTRSDNDAEALGARIKAANATMHALMKPLFKTRSVAKSTKMLVWRTIARAQVVYAAESYSLTELQLRRLDSFQQKWLRNVLERHPRWILLDATAAAAGTGVRNDQHQQQQPQQQPIENNNEQPQQHGQQQQGQQRPGEEQQQQQQQRLQQQDEREEPEGRIDYPKAEALLKEAGEIRLSDQVRIQRMRFFGHVVRRGENDDVCRMLDSTIPMTGARSVTRRAFWKTQVEEDMKERKLMKEDALDRVKWRRALREWEAECAQQLGFETGSDRKVRREPAAGRATHDATSLREAALHVRDGPVRILPRPANAAAEAATVASGG